MNFRRAALWGIPVLVLTACWGDNKDSGSLTLGVTDAPMDDATSVVVQFTGVEVKPADGEARRFEFAPPRSIDLLALSGMGSQILLDGVTVPAGRYEWLRLEVDAADDGVDDSYIDLKDGTRHELAIPSGSQTGLKLASGFLVPQGGSASFTIDFDLRKSVHEPMDGSSAYVLRPALRIVDNTRAGAIAGTVAPAAMIGCAPAVYVFDGGGVTPDDVDGNPPDPLTTARVRSNSDGTFDYRADYLPEGPYTVTLACDAGSDDPDSDDSLSYSGTQDADVIAGQATRVDFPAP